MSRYPDEPVRFDWTKPASKGGLPQSVCVACGYKMDAATATTGRSVCLNCGQIMLRTLEQAVNLIKKRGRFK